MKGASTPKILHLYLMTSLAHIMPGFCRGSHDYRAVGIAGDSSFLLRGCLLGRAPSLYATPSKGPPQASEHIC